MSEDIKAIGRWLESTIAGETPNRLDEPFPVKVTALDIIRMRDSGLLPEGATKPPAPAIKQAVAHKILEGRRFPPYR